MRSCVPPLFAACTLLAALCASIMLACARQDPPTSSTPQPPTPAAAPAPTGARPAAAPAPGESVDLPKVRLATAFPKLTFNRPVQVTHAGDGSNLLYVIEQRGRIRVFDNDDGVEEAGVFLDIRDRVAMKHNEEGLLALAFHPDYKTNGQFYVYYSKEKPKRNVIARFTRSAADPNVADPASEQIILEVEQPYGNHNGSTLLFGPEGFLYASFGDGGLANDPLKSGQDLKSLLAKIIRIDVNPPSGASSTSTRSSDGLAYAIPADNPFVGRANARGEIWAYGLRNVWRMSFDRATGDLYAGDVGQNAWEEVDIITKGGNYGWNIKEGTHEFAGGSAEDALIDPIAEYDHRAGLSITGGYVYRGSKHPSMAGMYVFADYVTGRVWGLRWKNGVVLAKAAEILVEGSPRRYISSFGEDEAGELFACAFDRLDGRGSNEGRIYRVVPAN